MLYGLLGQVGNFTTIPLICKSYIINKRKYGAKSFEIKGTRYDAYFCDDARKLGLINICIMTTVCLQSEKETKN